MMRMLIVLLAAIMTVFSADATSPMATHVHDVERPYHEGDWTLQCNNFQLCEIIGVAKIPKDYVGVRAIVMIKRGIADDARPSLRLAFVDSMGSFGVPAPADGWRLYSRGLPKMPPPIRLALGPPDGDGAFRPPPEVGARLISALTRWPGSVIHDRGLKIATMPKGNLARLMRKMDQLQDPITTQTTAADTRERLTEHHYTILRASESEISPPEDVLLACDTRTYINRPDGARIGPHHHLWTGDCPEGYKIFLQREGMPPAKLDIRDSKGKIRPHSYAGFNTDTSLLEIMLPRNASDGCGRHLKLGFTGVEFSIIEDRRYDRCRAVPHELWPIVWNPTSWKYADTSPPLK